MSPGPLRVRVARGAGGAATIASDAFEATFEGPEVAPASATFALWLALPIAMRLGRDLHVEGLVAAGAPDGARRLVEAWSLWRPDLFAPVAATAAEATPTAAAPEGPDLLLFSGGVDSTHALGAWAGAGRPDLLTVLGMDYRRDDEGRFARLQAKTAAFRAAHAGRQVVVRSDAASVMRRFEVGPDIGHGFHLFAALSLFEASHPRAVIAADFTPEEYALVGPWGTGPLTNARFATAAQEVSTVGLDRSRADKVADLAADPLALGSLSFCVDYAARPENCGRCSKCVRTKAMFVAATGEVPPIFLDGAFSPSDLVALDLSRPTEVAFAGALLRRARASGHLAPFEGLAARLAAGRRGRSLRGRLYQARALLRTRLGRRG